jgi:5-methylcytosine-specific restriction enzyme A
MPERAKRPCNKPGCPNLTDARYCDDHAKAAQSQINRWRGSAHQRGYDRRWQAVRVQALRRDKYLCQRCLKDSRVTPATMVDHIIPIVVDPTLRLALDNLQSLDDACHALKTAEDKRKYSKLVQLPTGLGMGISFVFNDIAQDHARVKKDYLQFIKRDL